MSTPPISAAMPPGFANLPPISRAETAFRNLRGAIVGWELKPGTWITEAGLQELSTVGRTPTREAANRLVAMELLTAIPRNGYQVAPVTVHDAATLYDVWGSLAPILGRSVAGRVGPQVFALIQSLADETLEHEDPLVTTEVVFDELLRVASNRWLGTFSKPLFGHLQRLWVLALRRADRSAAALAWATVLSALQGHGDEVERLFIQFTEQSRDLTLKSVEWYVRESMASDLRPYAV